MLAYSTCRYSVVIVSVTPSLRLLLLNKLLEDGNTLFKKGSLSEASHRYQYALRRLPSSFAGQHRPIFEQLQLHLLLNLCRCKRKAGLFDEAVDLAEKVLNVSGVRRSSKKKLPR